MKLAVASIPNGERDGLGAIAICSLLPNQTLCFCCSSFEVPTLELLLLRPPMYDTIPFFRLR
jgi:hypothetical protein